MIFINDISNNRITNIEPDIKYPGGGDINDISNNRINYTEDYITDLSNNIIKNIEDDITD
jgi:hypothetical protein